MNTSGGIRIDVTGGNTIGDTDVADGQWHHVAAVFDPTVGATIADVALYVAGDAENQTAGTGTRTINTQSGQDVTIGNDDSSRFFDGQMRSVTIWDRR